VRSGNDANQIGAMPGRGISKVSTPGIASIILTHTAPSSFQIGDPATVAKKLKLT
jgi:hypothetical protein